MTSPSLCFNDTNIFNHRLRPIELPPPINNTTLATNETSTLISEPIDSSIIGLESRQIPSIRKIRPRPSSSTNRNRKRPANNYSNKKLKKTNYVEKFHHPIHPNQIIHHVYGKVNGDKRKKSVFIPVALYSVTKKVPKNLPKMSASNVSIKRKQINQNENSNENTMDGENDSDDYEMRKESAVYGYIQKPEVIEFKGQYYYGGNPNNQNQNYNHNSNYNPNNNHHYNNHHNNNNNNPSYYYEDTHDSPQRHSVAEYDDTEIHAPYYSGEHYHDIHDHHHHHDIPSYLPATSYETYDDDPPLSALILAKIKKSMEQNLKIML